MSDRYSLYKGDCLEIMQSFPQSEIDLIIADLPYGTTKNAWDSIIPFEPLWTLYWHILKPNGVIALTASQPFTSAVVMSQLQYFRHEWIWIKNRGSNFANTVREPMKEHESVLIFSRGKWTYNKQMQSRAENGANRAKYSVEYKTDSQNYNKFDKDYNVKLDEMRVPSSHQKFNTEVGLHPTQKPVALMNYIIKTYSNENDVVLDNCMGSGTTGIAAIQNNRSFIGIEKNNDYFKISEQRIEKFTQEMAKLNMQMRLF